MPKIFARPEHGGVRRCVVAGCGGTNKDGLSLHYFPFDRPGIFRQWVRFVKQTRKDWKGPSKTSVLCSIHFTEDSYPVKYRILESIGTTVNGRYLHKDAVPSINQSATLVLGKRTENPVLWNSTMCNTSKKPRRAFQKRESQRIIMEFEKQTPKPSTKVRPDCVDSASESPEDKAADKVQNEQTNGKEMPTVKNERTTGKEMPIVENEQTTGKKIPIILFRRQRKADYAQVKRKYNDKVIQVRKFVTTADVGVYCNLLDAEPQRLENRGCVLIEKYEQNPDIMDSECDELNKQGPIQNITDSGCVPLIKEEPISNIKDSLFVPSRNKETIQNRMDTGCVPLIEQETIPNIMDSGCVPLRNKETIQNIMDSGCVQSIKQGSIMNTEWVPLIKQELILGTTGTGCVQLIKQEQIPDITDSEGLQLIKQESTPDFVDAGCVQFIKQEPISDIMDSGCIQLKKQEPIPDIIDSVCVHFIKQEPISEIMDSECIQ